MTNQKTPTIPPDLYQLEGEALLKTIGLEFVVTLAAGSSKCSATIAINNHDLTGHCRRSFEPTPVELVGGSLLNLSQRIYISLFSARAALESVGVPFGERMVNDYCLFLERINTEVGRLWTSLQSETCGDGRLYVDEFPPGFPRIMICDQRPRKNPVTRWDIPTPKRGRTVTDLDNDALNTAVARVYRLMKSNRWVTATDIRNAGGSEGLRRLRELRRVYGLGYEKRRANGDQTRRTYEYRLTTNCGGV